MSQFIEIFELCNHFLELESENKNALAIKAYYLLSFDESSRTQEAIAIVKSLTNIDLIRENYWEWVLQNIE